MVGTAQPQLSTSLTPVLLSFHLNPPKLSLPSQSPRAGRSNHLLKGQFAAVPPVLNKAEPLMLHFLWGSNTSAAPQLPAVCHSTAQGAVEGLETNTNFRGSRKSRKPQQRLALTLTLSQGATGPEGHGAILAAVPQLGSAHPLGTARPSRAPRTLLTP